MFSEHEAWQLHTGITAPAKCHVRVEMSGQHVAIGAWLGVMRADERAKRPRCIDAIDVERRRGVAGMRVVIASHEPHLNVRVLYAPCGNRIERALLTTSLCVQQVAQNDNLLRAGGVQHARKASEV